MSDHETAVPQDQAPARKTRTLWADSILYAGGNVLARAGSLVTFLVLTRIFSTGIYGAIDALISYGILAGAFVTFGMDSALARFYYETGDLQIRRRLALQALCVQGVPTVGVVTFGLLFPAEIARWLIGDDSLAGCVLLMAVSLPFAVLDAFCRNLLRWSVRKYQYILVTIGSSALMAGLATLLCLGMGMGVEGVFLAQFGSFAAMTALGLAFCRQLLGLGKAHFRLREILAYAWPNGLNGLLHNCVPAIDRFFLIHFTSLMALGWYAAGSRVAGLIGIPIVAFQTAWGPFAYSIHKEKEAGETYSGVLLMYTLLFSGGLLLLIPFAGPLMALVASSKFEPGAEVFAPAGFALMVEAGAWIAGIGVDLSKKSYLGSISYGLGVAVLVLALAVLVPRFGYVGAGYAMLLSKLAQATLYACFGLRAHPIRVRWGLAAGVLALAIVTGVTSSLLRRSHPGWTAGIALPAAAACLSGFALTYSRVGRAIRRDSAQEGGARAKG